MSSIVENSVVWLDGELLSGPQAQVSVLTHTLHYGLGVFEGTRFYRQHGGGSAIFRLEDHLARLRRSAHMLDIELACTREELLTATIDTVGASGLESGYVRHIVFLGHGSMGLYPRHNPVRLAIAVWPWGAYLGEEGMEKGVRCKVSSWMRQFPASMLTKAKATGGYIPSILAKREAVSLGFDEALMLDTQGYVVEASGSNLFIVRDGDLVTPPAGNILEGITRDTVLTLAREAGLTVIQQRVPRDDLYVADEAFLTGTATEVTPIREVDGRTIGQGGRGPVTTRLQQEFFALVRGESSQRLDWLTPVSATPTSTAAG